MKKNETELLEKFSQDKDILMKWSHFLIQSIKDKIFEYDPTFQADYFFKTLLKPRLKDDTGLILKAFHRKKPYKDPYSEITDKVGIRFVVLTNKDVALVSKAIDSFQEHWDISKDRDYEEERKKEPFTFTYQSKHFIVRPKSPIDIGNGDIVQTSICCEIQLRTLAQHAYAELSHFTTYKPKFKNANQDSHKRILARSVALIETLDNNFDEVMNTFEVDYKEEKTIIDLLISRHREIFSDEIDIGLNEYYLDSMQWFSNQIDINELKEFIQKPEIEKLVKSRNSAKARYASEPIIWLLYFIANKFPYDQFIDNFEFDADEIRYAFTDLGKSTSISQ